VFLYRLETRHAACALLRNQRQQGLYPAVLLYGVAERLRRIHLVSVPTAYLCACQITLLNQISHDSLSRPFCDAHLLRHVAKANFRVFRNRQQNMAMIGQERPAA